MRVLLPPSEAKTPGGRGRPLGEPVAGDAGSTGSAKDHDLAAARRVVRQALARLLDGDPADAARDLLLPGGVAPAALATNARIDSSPTTPALRRYAGTVYEGLSWHTAPEPVRRVARRDVLIFSGLFGVVAGGEAVPDYRVPAKAVLPGVGVVGTYWRPHLDELFDGAGGRRALGRGLIVDLRSGDYAAMWRPKAALRERTVAVRVLSPLPRGGHGIVSYNSKLGKGRLARELLVACADGAEPASVDDVARAWARCGGADAVTTPAGLDLFTA